MTRETLTFASHGGWGFRILLTNKSQSGGPWEMVGDAWLAWFEGLKMGRYTKRTIVDIINEFTLYLNLVSTRFIRLLVYNLCNYKSSIVIYL